MLVLFAERRGADEQPAVPAMMFFHVSDCSLSPFLLYLSELIVDPRSPVLAAALQERAIAGALEDVGVVTTSFHQDVWEWDLYRAIDTRFLWKVVGAHDELVGIHTCISIDYSS